MHWKRGLYWKINLLYKIIFFIIRLQTSWFTYALLSSNLQEKLTQVARLKKYTWIWEVVSSSKRLRLSGSSFCNRLNSLWYIFFSRCNIFNSCSKFSISMLPLLIKSSAIKEPSEAISQNMMLNNLLTLIHLTFHDSNITSY